MKTLFSLWTLARRTLNCIVGFIRHPIWCYSVPQIARLVKRDWEGPIATNARDIMRLMVATNTTRLDVEFSENGKTFIVLECVARKPNTAPHLRGDSIHD
jgi:hypothetical protein